MFSDSLIQGLASTIDILMHNEGREGLSVTCCHTKVGVRSISNELLDNGINSIVLFERFLLVGELKVGATTN